MLKNFSLLFAFHIACSASQMDCPIHSVLKETKQTFEIVSHLAVFQVFDQNGPVKLLRIGKPNDGGYVVPEIAIKQADIVLGYGISNDISFEESIAKNYDKPSFGFDGTCNLVKPMDNRCKFIHQCIASKKAPPQKNYSTFEHHLDLIHGKNKKMLIKMDIEGDEYETLPDILEHTPNITGIVLEIHFVETNQISKALSLLKLLSKDFLLVHVHGNNHCVDRFETTNSMGSIPRVLELSYMNKNLISSYFLQKNQDHPTPLDMSNHPDYLDAKFTILTPDL